MLPQIDTAAPPVSAASTPPQIVPLDLAAVPGSDDGAAATRQAETQARAAALQQRGSALQAVAPTDAAARARLAERRARLAETRQAAQ